MAWRGVAWRGLDVVVAGKPCPREFRDDVVPVAPGRDPDVKTSKRMPASRTTTGHDLVTSQEPARDRFSTDSAARKTNLLRDPRNASRGGRRPDPATGRTVRRFDRNEGRDGG